MTMRFCPKCDQDVEATSGYCLLGHRLALDPPVASIGELRDEVDRAFEEASLEVAAVAAGGLTAPTATAPSATVPPVTATTDASTTASAGMTDAPVHPRRTGPPPPPPPRRSPAPGSGAPISTTVAPAPAPSHDPGPGPVPTAEELVARKASVWKGLDADIDLVGDPIGAFAPPPSMDWGPSKGRLLQRRVTRAKRSKRAEPAEPTESSKRPHDSQA